MTETEWFEKWWAGLPKHNLTSQNKGSKAECRIEIKKLKPDDKLRDHIDWYTRERTYRYAKMKNTHKIDQRRPTFYMTECY